LEDLKNVCNFNEKRLLKPKLIDKTSHCRQLIKSLFFTGLIKKLSKKYRKDSQMHVEL